MRQVLRALCFVVLICADVWTAATIARAVGSGDGSGGIFWSAIALLALILAVAFYVGAVINCELTFLATVCAWLGLTAGNSWRAAG